MATTTPNLNLIIPAKGDTDWEVQADANYEKIDAALSSTVSGSHIVASGTDLQGTLTFEGSGGVSLHPTGQTLVISGSVSAASQQAIDDSIATHAADVDAHHTRYTDSEAITATESSRLTLSGTLSSEIDSDINTHASNPSAHHSRYTKNENDAIIGSDGITITSGTNSITTEGFRTEFVSASGSLQNQIDAVEGSDVDEVNSLTGNITLLGKGEVGVTVEGQNIVISGTDHTAGAGSDFIPNALEGSNGITIVSGTSVDTVQGFRTEFVNASGTLSAEIDSDIATHTSNASAHHTKYTDSEAISALEPTTSSLAASGVATDATVSANTNQIVTTSGHLQTQIDAVEGSDVDSVNTLTGDLTLVGAGIINVTDNGTETITISGTDHTADTISDALIGGTGITVTSGSNITTIDGHIRYTKDENDAIVGSDGITIVSGTNEIDVQGFRTEFVSASGSLQSQLDSIEGSDVDSINSLIGDVTVLGKGEVNVTIEGQNVVVSGTEHATDTDTDTVSNALEGADGITVTSGTSVDTITGFRTEFVNASGTLSTEIDSDITTHAGDASAHHSRYTDTEAISALEPTTSQLAASGVATDAAVDANTTQIVTTSGHLQTQIDSFDPDDVENALIGADGITIISGSSTITVQGFRTEFLNASGTLSAEIDSDISTHAANSSAHHTRYIDAEAIAALEPTTSQLAASGIATDANIVSVSGHLQNEIDNINVDEADVSSLEGLQGDLTLAGADGITITDDSVSEITITGFRTEFINASGTLSNEIDSDISAHSADSGAHHERYSKEENDAITGSDGITIVSGSNSIDVQGFRTEFVNASGSLQSDIDAIDSSVTLQEAYDNGDGSITISSNPVLVSGTTGDIFKVQSNNDTVEFNVRDNIISITNPLRADDGSASVPTYSFTSDSNTGMYRASENVLCLAAAGNDQVTITGSTGMGVDGEISAGSGFFSDSLTISGSPVILSSGSGFVEKIGDIMEGNLITQNLLPDGNNIWDIGDTDNRYRRIFLGQGDLADGIVFDLPTAVGTSAPSYYQFNLGGGDSGSGGEGGQAYFLMDDLSVFGPAGTKNEIIFDVGAASFFETNSVVFLSSVGGAVGIRQIQLDFTTTRASFSQSAGTSNLLTFETSSGGQVIMNSNRDDVDFLVRSEEGKVPFRVFGDTGRIAVNFTNGTSSVSSRVTVDGNIAISGTGAMSVPDGSASEPSYTFNDDRDTGIYSPAADVVNVAAGGLDILTVSGTSSTAGVGVAGDITVTGTVFAGQILNIPVLSSDPTTLREGDVWINSGNNSIRFQSGGTKYELVGVAV